MENELEVWTYLNRKISKVTVKKDARDPWAKAEDPDRYYSRQFGRRGVMGEDFFETSEQAIAHGIQKLKKQLALAEGWKREVDRLESILAWGNGGICKHCHGTGVVTEVLGPLVATATNETLP